MYSGNGDQQYRVHFSGPGLQLMWARTVQCLTVYLSSASSQEGALLVSECHACPGILLLNVSRLLTLTSSLRTSWSGEVE